jgi:hypothetical protein
MAGTTIRFGEGIQLHSGPNGGALLVALLLAGVPGVSGIFPFLIMKPIETQFGVYEYATVAH